MKHHHFVDDGRVFGVPEKQFHESFQRCCRRGVTSVPIGDGEEHVPELERTAQLLSVRIGLDLILCNQSLGCLDTCGKVRGGGGLAVIAADCRREFVDSLLLGSGDADEKEPRPVDAPKKIHFVGVFHRTNDVCPLAGYAFADGHSVRANLLHRDVRQRRAVSRCPSQRVSSLHVGVESLIFGGANQLDRLILVIQKNKAPMEHLDERAEPNLYGVLVSGDGELRFQFIADPSQIGAYRARECDDDFVVDRVFASARYPSCLYLGRSSPLGSFDGRTRWHSHAILLRPLRDPPPHRPHP